MGVQSCCRINGEPWLGTTVKLGQTRATIYSFQQQNGLAHDQVMALLEDREGNIWIGTQGGGVSKFAGERFVNYTSAQGLAWPDHAVAQVEELLVRQLR
jgi:ligand-binding sensor domain-containing protein